MAIFWFLSIFLAALLLYSSYKRRRAREYKDIAAILMALSSNLMIWIVCEFATQIAYDDRVIIFFHEFKYVAIVAIPFILLDFATRLYNGEKILTRYRIPIFTIYFVTLFLMFTNSFHGLFRQSIVVTKSLTNIVETKNGVLYYIHVVCSYSIIVYSLSIMYSSYKRQPIIYRNRTALVLIGIIFSFISNFLFMLSHILFDAHFDFTPISFGIVAWTIYYAFYEFKPNYVINLAKNLLIKELAVGIVFLDKDEKIFYTNSYFCTLIGINTDKLLEMHLDNLPSNIEKAILQSKIQEEVLYQAVVKDKLKVFSVKHKPLYDDKDRHLGSLYYFQDNTEDFRKVLELESHC